MGVLSLPLLDRSRLSWAIGDDGDLELLGEQLHAAGDVGDFLLPVLDPAAGLAAMSCR
jgi:hypothetical protein